MTIDTGTRATRLGRALLADGLLALLILAVGLASAAQAEAWAPERTPLDPLGAGLIAAAALPLAVRRRWPVPVLAVSVVATSGYLILGYPFGGMLLAVAVASYTVAARLPLRAALPAAAGALLVLLLHLVVQLDGEGAFGDPLGVLPGSAWIVVPFAVGSTVRAARESAARARAEQVRQVADQERLRVAQEVHDVVGHGLAAINMQAEIALHLLPTRPEQAEPALTTISRTSKQALDELRATLSVVRQDAQRAPEAGLARLPELVDRMSGTGVAVTVRVAGARRELPAAVDLAAYRVVQESLTNVLRHAGTGAATVRIGYRPDGLEIEVTNQHSAAAEEPRLAAGSGAGHGIAGMQARVAALGGGFEAGPGRDGGFRVHAWLPAPEPAEPGLPAPEPAEPGRSAPEPDRPPGRSP